MAGADEQTLPMPDFDHLPLATLQHRIRSFDLHALQRVADYDRAAGVSPQTAGPEENPPLQGVPCNPAQPRSAG